MQPEWDSNIHFHFFLNLSLPVFSLLDMQMTLMLVNTALGNPTVKIATILLPKNEYKCFCFFNFGKKQALKNSFAAWIKSYTRSCIWLHSSFQRLSLRNSWDSLDHSRRDNYLTQCRVRLPVYRVLPWWLHASKWTSMFGELVLMLCSFCGCFCFNVLQQIWTEI